MNEPRYLTCCWQVIAFAREIVPGQLLSRRIHDRAIVLFRGSNEDMNNSVVAMEDRCPHRSAPLSKGRLIGNTLQCGYHGLRFALDGRCLEVPGQTLIPNNARVVTFPVIEKHKLIWIWMGAPEAAHETLIPDVPWMDDESWVAAEGYHFVAANYQLLTDNLLDLSHETYLHTQTIGNEAVADTPVSVTRTKESVRVVKEISSCNPPPFYQYLARLPADAPVRRWQRTEYHPPGYTVIDVGVESLNRIANSNRVKGRVINLITPATPTSSHYFWAFARNFRLDEPQVTEFLRDNVSRTFDEDKEMLEAQQRNLGDEERDPQYRVAIKADTAPLHARRLLKSLIKLEAEQKEH